MRWQQFILTAFVLTLFQFQAVSAEDTKNIQTEISGAENSLSNAAGNNESAAAEQVGLSDVNDNEIAPDDDDDFSDSLMKLNMQVSASQISATINSKRGEMQLDGMDINRFLPKITKKAKTAGKTKKNKGKKEITAQNKAQKEYQPEKNDNGDIPRMKNPKTLADLFGGNNIQYGGQLINRNVCIPCLNINAGMKKTMLKRIMVKDKSSLKGIVK